MRRVIVTLLICVFALGMNAQDMTSVFTAMPDQYIPQLEHAWRKDWWIFILQEKNPG